MLLFRFGAKGSFSCLFCFCSSVNITQIIFSVYLLVLILHYIQDRLLCNAGLIQKDLKWSRKVIFLLFGLSLYINYCLSCVRKRHLVTGYCVYEKKKNREIKNPKQIKMKNGRYAIKGTCASCGKTIFKIGKLK
jgi:hypothetical protein